MTKPVWLTLCDDGFVNVHIQKDKPRVIQGKKGQYQDDFAGSIPANIAHALTGLRLRYWEPVRLDNHNSNPTVPDLSSFPVLHD